MKPRSSIFLKLMLFITPLVCVPVAIVGYLATKASEDRVNRLARQEQTLQLEAAAKRISDVFSTCRQDLETLSRLPTLEDFHLARSFRLEAEADFNRDNLVRIFSDFISRSRYYQAIVFLNRVGLEEIKVDRHGEVKAGQHRDAEDFFRKAVTMTTRDIYFSGVLGRSSPPGYLLQAAKPFFTGWQDLAGVVLIEVDFDAIVDIVKAIHIGHGGYAFLIDQFGQNIAHPHFEPYRFNFDNYPDDSLKELAREMSSGRSGWKSYHFQGEDKEAAFAPVPSMGWSLAVTIPLEDLKRESMAIQTRVIQVVVVTLILTGLGLAVLSYRLLRPVRTLVQATHRIASGDLSQEIPVQSRDELGELTESFNRMVANLSRIQSELLRSEKLISLGRLSAGVAHEIRNPLNAMKGAIVHLRRRRADDNLIAEYTELVLEEIERLNRFVTDFLHFSRQTPPKRATTDLNRLVQSVQKLFAEPARSKAINFLGRLDPELPHLFIDPQQMEQVLLNLVLNALEAVPDGGTVTISTSLIAKEPGRESSRLARVTIHDNGVGIPEENLLNIFDPFFSTKETGTGLGLPLSLGIVELHGGTLSISSHPGQGTSVFLELPLESNQPRGGQA